MDTDRKMVVNYMVCINRTIPGSEYKHCLGQKASGAIGTPLAFSFLSNPSATLHKV